MYEFNNLIFDCRADAEIVLANMREIADLYSFVTVCDLYDIAGYGGKYTDTKYGWTESCIRKAAIARVRSGGFMLKLPRPVPYASDEIKIVHEEKDLEIIIVLDEVFDLEKAVQCAVDLARSAPERKVKITIL